MKIRIVIDSGHGGYDPGAIGRDGTKEKDVNLLTAKNLGEIFRKDRRFEVNFTRVNDRFITLSQRAEIANRFAAHLFISIHYNSSVNRKVEGSEVFYWREGSRFSTSGARLAQLISKRLSKVIHVNRGIKGANFAVLKKTRMTAVLIEPEFISNPVKEASIKNRLFQARIARAIYLGVLDYFGMKEVVIAPETFYEVKNSKGIQQGVYKLWKDVCRKAKEMVDTERIAIIERR